MPTMAVATLYDLYKTLKPRRDIIGEGNLAPLAVDHHQWIVLGIGFVVSFIVALAVVAWFMRWVRARGFTPFAIYRIALGIVLIVLLMRGSI
jgi:undecaprenyl-diphosphatase